VQLGFEQRQPEDEAARVLGDSFAHLFSSMSAQPEKYITKNEVIT
jgi:hypothetical protein